jgi:D-sedoheptulose 7-phosphate isomerase
MKFITALKKNMTASIEAKKSFLERQDQMEIFASAVECLVARYKQGGRIYIAGNGGSAADAQHLAAEFVSKLARDRDPLPAEALTVDSSILTAIGNDYGFDELFSRQVAGKMTDKDVFLGITTSGNSRNIIRALEQCRRMSIPTILFSGHSGGIAQSLSDYCVLVSGETTATIQELHIVLAHTLCECVEAAIFDK